MRRFLFTAFNIKDSLTRLLRIDLSPRERCESFKSLASCPLSLGDWVGVRESLFKKLTTNQSSIINPKLNVCLATFITISLMALSGCGSPSSKTETLPTCSKTPSVLRLNLGTEPPTLDPTRMTDLTSFQVFNLLMWGLVRLDKQGNIAPALARRWTLSPDGRTYRFTLDPLAKWSDGQPVTAAQFVDGWRYGLEPKRGNPYAFLLFDVTGAKAFQSGVSSDFKSVGIRAVDPHTVEIRLDHPVAYFLSLLTFPTAMPLRLELIAQHGSTWTEAGHLVGTGPFVLTQWQHDSQIVVSPNPHNPARSKQLKAVHLAMMSDANTALGVYRQGGLDMVETLPQLEIAQLAKRPDAHRQTMNAIFYLGFNAQKPPFTNPKVRQAFALAVDRQALLTFLQKPDQPLKGLFPPGVVGYDSTVGLGYDPVKARALLAEAGYPGGKGLPEVTLGFPSRFELRREAEVLQYFWQTQLGVRVRLASTEWKQYLQQLGTDPPGIYRESWYADYPDPDTFASLFTSYQGSNHTRWKQTKYDKAVQQTARQPNGPARQAMYKALQQHLLEQEAVIAPLYANTKVWLAAPYVQGVPINSMNQWDLEDTHLTGCEP
jgi:oligopeptide transport system substrate-binding protein